MWIITATHPTGAVVVRQEWTKTAAEIVAKVYEAANYIVKIEWSQR